MISLPGWNRRGPLAGQALLHGAALVLAFQALGRLGHPEALAYVPWVVGAGGLTAAVLILTRPPAPGAAAALVLWAFAIQLVLLPPGFTTAFRLLAMAPVLIQTVLTLPRGLGPVLALAELAVFLAGQGTRTAWGAEVPGANDETLWGLGSVGAALVGGAWVLDRAFRQRDRAEAELAHLKEGVQQVVSANVGFQERAASAEATSSRRERLRITREIHDIVGYTLTNQTMVLQAAAVLLDRDHGRLRELLTSAEESARAGLQEVRQALRQLRLGAEEPVPVLNRLTQLCRTFDQATGVRVELTAVQLPDDLPFSVGTVLYRLVQEGLTNAFLHGQASRVSVGISMSENDLLLHLADNGRGAEQVKEGIGLTGMRERLGPLGGDLAYEAGVHGFTIWARIPRAALSEEP